MRDRSLVHGRGLPKRSQTDHHSNVILSESTRTPSPKDLNLGIIDQHLRPVHQSLNTPLTLNIPLTLKVPHSRDKNDQNRTHGHVNQFSCS